jgi:hypothetical protein
MSIQRLARLQELKEATAVEFGLPADSERVITVAGLKLHREVLLETLAAGGPLEASALINVTKTIAELSPPPPIPPIKFEIIDNPPPMYWCSACGKTQEFRPPEPEATSKAKSKARSAGTKSAKTDAPEPTFPNYTPEPPPAPPPPDYAPARDFHGKGAPVKQDVGARNEFLGAFKQPSNDYSFASAYKPRSDIPGS